MKNNSFKFMGLSFMGALTSIPQTAYGDNHQNLDARLIELNQKIEALEKRPNLTDKESVTDGNQLSLKFYGHINRALLYRYNGIQGHLDHVDNDAHSSRFAFLASGQSSAKQTVGGLLELNASQNPALNSDIRNTRSTPAAVTVRNAQIFVKDKTYGEVYLGRGPMASDSSIEDPDMSGVSHVLLGGDGLEMVASVSLINKATNRKQTLGGGSNTTLRVQDIIPSTDGLSRQDRIRYNTPSIYGLTLNASHAYNTSVAQKGNDLWDVALRWNTTIYDHKYSAVIAYAEDHSMAMTGNVSGTTTSMKQTSGSAGVLFKNGFNLFIAGAHREYKFKGSRDGFMYFGKIGYQHKYFESGMTALAVDYGNFENFVIDTTSSNSLRFKYKGRLVGIALNQNLERIATDLYVAYRYLSFDVKGHGTNNTKFKPVQAVMMGARLKF